MADRAKRAGGATMLATVAAAAVLAAVPAAAGAQSARGSATGVPMTGRSWNAQGWTGPEDGPDMRRNAVDRGVIDRRDDVGPAPLAGPPPRRDDFDRAPPPLDRGTQFTGRYERPYRGGMLPSYFATPAFHVRDFGSWGLAPPAVGLRWVRYYDDAVLVSADGRVSDVRYGIDWNRGDRFAGRGPARPLPPGQVRDDRAGPHGRLADRAYDDGYDDGYEDGRDDGVGRGGTVVVRDGRVVDGAGYGTGHGYDYGTGYAAGGYAPGTVVVTTTPGTITTTTVTEDVVTTRARSVRRPVARRKTWTAASPRWSN